MSYDVTSPSNQRIKWLARLRERRHRDAEGVFVVEGRRIFERARAAGLEPVAVFTVSRDLVANEDEAVIVAPQVLDRVSYRSQSQGLIAVFPQLETGLPRIEPGRDPFLLVVEGVEKPGNLGAMLRTASALGTDAVITVGGTVDLHNPNVIRSSTGALFSVPVAVSHWDHALPWLSQHGVRLICAAPDTRVSLWEADLTGPIALVVGAEDSGLSDRALAVADTTVSIPQPGIGVDSLNASVAAAILLAESLRQRSGH